MDTSALKLCSIFALPPNHLQYCGRDSAHQVFLDCINQDKCSKVKSEIKNFIVLWPYLKTIADITGFDPFSYEVIEAYWFGNQLLQQVKSKHYPLLLKNLRIQGVPNFLIKEIKDNPPAKFIPTHLFNILHVGVGRASGTVPFNLENINHCMLRWGKIIKLDKHKHLATIKLSSLKHTRNQYKYSIKTETHPYHPDWFQNLQAGQSACVHWKLLCKVPTPTEETNLAYYTTRLINSL